MKKIIPIVLAAMAVALLYVRFAAFRPKYAIVRAGSAEIRVEVADTLGKRARGLSRRDSLADGQGMLFPLGKQGRYTFWMKDMRFPLDFIWIRDGHVVDITEDVPYPVGVNPPVRVQPREPASAVLEVNADFTEKHGVKVGDGVEILES